MFRNRRSLHILDSWGARPGARPGSWEGRMGQPWASGEVPGPSGSWQAQPVGLIHDRVIVQRRSGGEPARHARWRQVDTRPGRRWCVRVAQAGEGRTPARRRPVGSAQHVVCGPR